MTYFELIYLKRYLKNKLSNGRVTDAITSYRHQIELFIENKEESFRLICSTAPGNAALFTDKIRPAKKSNTPRFFKPIYRRMILDVGLVNKDRVLWLEIEGGIRLWFRLFGNKANVLLAKDGTVLDAFKNDDEIGKNEPLTYIVIPEKEIKDGDDVVTGMQAINPRIPKWELNEIAENPEVANMNRTELRFYMQALTRQLEEKPVFRVLKNGKTTLFNEENLPLETQKILENVNDLIEFRFRNYYQIQRLNQQKNGLVKILKRQLKRLESSISNLKKAEKGQGKADIYEKFGHLLMAQSHLPKPAANNLLVEDFYNQGTKINIPVNTDLSMVENAGHYYQRSKAALQSVEEASERLPNLVSKYNRTNKMLENLIDIDDLRVLADWKKKYKKELDTLGFGTKKKEEQNLPFFTIKLEGYTIWIGKNAKSNDKLVQLSHKEDIWMHARGVPGSHLLIRMNNNKSMPAKMIIEQAAAFAAYQSKAKGSALVPVIYTKRKYIRKPKGAAAGAVLVQKEAVVIVEPQKPSYE